MPDVLRATKKLFTIFFIMAVFLFAQNSALAAAPAWQASSVTAASTGADVTVVLPVHLANDIMLLQVLVRDTNDTITWPTGWTQITTVDRGTTSRYWWAWHRATSGSETNPLVDKSTATGDTYAAVTTYRGANTVGDPWEVIGIPNTSTTAAHILNGITTLSLDSLIIASLCGENNTAASVSYTATSPSTLTARLYDEDVAGSNGTCASGSAAKTTIGATGNVTATWSATVVGSGGIVLALKPTFTTISNFVTAEPGNSTIAPGAPALVDSFGLATSAGTDTVTGATVTLAAGTGARVATVAITNNGDTVTYCSVTPSGDTATLTGCGIAVSTTNTQFKIKITAIAHTSMPAPPGGSYAVTGTVTAFTSTNTQAGTDSGSSTVTIDNTSPAGTTGANATGGDAQVTVGWTNPADSDFQKVIIYCKTSSITESPTEGTDPSVDGTACDATARVKYSGSTSPQIFSGLTNGTTYYFRIYARDNNGNFTAIASTQQVSAMPSPTPTTTLGNGSDPVNPPVVAPSGATTMADAFTFVTNTGTDSITAVVVGLAAGTSGGLSLVEITNDAGSVVYGSTANPASDTPSVSLSGLTATTGSTQYKIRVTPKTHANMPSPPGSTYSVTAKINSWTGTNPQAGSDTAGTTVTIDNASPANVTSATGSAGNAEVTTSWTNPADSDFHSTVVLRRASSAVTDVPVEGTTYVAGNTIGTATVACVIATPTATCVDSGLTNGVAYHYKIFSKDSNGNYAATGVVPTGSPFTPVAPTFTTTIGTGTNPSSVTLAPSDPITDLDTFTLVTSGNTDSITALTVTLTGTNSFQSLSEVRITSSTGATTYFSAVTNPSSNTVSFSGGTPIPATTSTATFKVRITPKTHANMPVPPGATYSVGGTVFSFTSTNGQAGTDSGSATITIDNLSPSGATSVSGSSGNTQVTLNWTTSASADFSRSVMLRWTGASAGGEVPTEGTDYTNGNTITTATVVCVRTADAASTAVSGTDGTGTGGCSATALTNGQAYTYKVFQKDSNGNYDVGVAMGTFTPSPTPTTTLGTGSDHVATTIAPGASATDVDQFTLQTNTSTETITSVTVNLSTNSGVDLITITNSSDTVLGTASSPTTGSNVISVSGMSAGTSATTFKIRATPLGHNSMPSVPGGAYAITAYVTSWAGSFAHTGSDTNTNALTIDNASPANVTSATGSAGNAQVTTSWTNPADSDFHSTVVLRRATSAVADVPVEGTTYVAGNTIGTATVACVIATPTATCVDTGLTNGTAYHYKIFSKDSNGNYAATGVVPTGSPFTPSLATFTITSSAGTGGTISPLGVTNVAQGSSQSYTLTPNLGYDVASLTVDGSPAATSSPYTYVFGNVQANHTIAVTFIQVTPTYTITSTAGANGTISPLGATVFLQGASQTYTITPTSGYVVDTLVVDSVSIATSTSHTFTNITANHTIDVTFSLIPPPPGSFAITATAGTGGSISPSGVTIVTQGNNQSYTITPDSGYNIATLTVDSVSVATSTSYTFTNVQANHTINGTFVALPPGAQQADTGPTRPTTVTFSGKAFPGGKIAVIDKQLNIEKVIGQDTIAGADGSFEISFVGVLQALHSFGIVARDSAGRSSQSKFFFVNTISDDLTAKDLLLPPTAELQNRQVTRGTNAVILGSAVPGYTIHLELDGILVQDMLAAKDGTYKFEIPTGTLEFGSHALRTRQADSQSEKRSDFSTSRTLTISRLAVVQADLNSDSKIDIRDWSIFLSLWGSKSATGRTRIDFNTDGKVDIADFSIFIKTIRKK